MKSNHMYRTTIYLGKANYEALNEFSKELNIAIATLAKLAVEDGLENLRKEVKLNEPRNEQE